MTRQNLLTISLSRDDHAADREALAALAASVGSSGYSDLSRKIAAAFQNEPKLATAVVQVLLLLQAADLSEDARQKLLDDLRDIFAQIYAYGVI